jgi:glycosyltransferase involved in cell wall biosynthesis
MKILQLINRFPWPLKDGGALGYYNFTKGYHDAGCELTVLAFNTSKHYIEFEQLPEQVKSLANFHLVPLDNQIKPLAALGNLLFSSQSYHVSRFISKDFDKALTELLLNNEFDVVVFESIFMAPYLKTVQLNSQAKCILRAHNVEHEIWQRLAIKTANPFKQFYLQILAKRLQKFEMGCMNTFDALTFVTKTDALHFKQFGLHQPFHVAPTGIDTERLNPDQTKVISNTILHIGSMDWMPNQEAVEWFIQEVWPSLKKQHPELVFKIAGRNTPTRFFAFQGNGIEVLGEVDDAIELMQTASLMVVPLFSGSGIRIKILEGMALGKCIVSTQLGYSGIDAQTGIHIHQAESASNFVTVISNLLANPLLIKQTSVAARILIEEQYESKGVIQKLLNFYQSINIDKDGTYTV